MSPVSVVGGDKQIGASRAGLWPCSGTRTLAAERARGTRRRRVVIMRRWILGATLAVTVGVAGWAVATSHVDQTCFANTAIDGTVQLGGPELADEAFATFLSGIADSYEIVQTDVAEYRRSEANGDVTYAADDVTITATRQTNGWWIGAIERRC